HDERRPPLSPQKVRCRSDTTACSSKAPAVRIQNTASCIRKVAKRYTLCGEVTIRIFRGLRCMFGKPGSGRLAMQSTAVRYFLAVVDAGSISSAAEQLRIAGSAVSRQIAGLEDSLGVRLFERRARGMMLTPAGERLATYARTSAAEAQR